jgi:RNA polymerase sigma-70 factor (ECF subfamily)
MEAVAPARDVGVMGAAREQRFFAFVEGHQERAVRMAWRLIGGDLSAAEDVAQQAFYKAYRGLDRFRDDASLATWFHRILINEARSYRRWRGLRERWHDVWIDDATPDPMPAASPDPGLQRRLAAALAQLSRGQREVFVLVYLEGFTLEQTAERLGKALGTIKSQLHRGLQHLRGELADLHHAPPHAAGGETP